MDASRYHILEEIAQGGLGSVYRARDLKMGREVAVKRIGHHAAGDLQEEAARQLLEEAGALAALNHPNIVTLHDVGSDADGPFVVMELIHGPTLDDVVEKAPLTWPDFFRLAAQTQEALVAAHDAGLLHRDIKPGNVMLSWLPSGRFQVKVVDFGLAVLGRRRSPSVAGEGEEIFGSIPFMAPEQFERGRLDVRTDLYAMGCVYYHALTGELPFPGNDGAEVMASHLAHRVRPLAELRPDLPSWACEWVMWHLARRPGERPENARASLESLLENEQPASQPMTSQDPSSESDAPKRPRLIIPGAQGGGEEASPPATRVEPAPLAPPPAAAEEDTRDEAPAPPPALLVEEQEAEEQEVGRAPTEAPAAIPAAAPVRTGPMQARGPVATSPPAPVTSPGAPAPSVAGLPVAGLQKRKRGMGNAAKTAIAAILAIVVVLLAVVLVKRSSDNRQIARFNDMMQEVGDTSTTELPVNYLDLENLLRNAASLTPTSQRQDIYRALFLARATDGTDVDARIADFALTASLVVEVREVLIRDVLRQRGNPDVVPALLAHVRATDDVRTATAALQASRDMARDDQFDAFLGVIQFTNQEAIRRAAEDSLAELIGRSERREELGRQLAGAYQGAVGEGVRHSLLRLMGRAGGADALAAIRGVLDSGSPTDQLAAAAGLAAWPDEAEFDTLLDFIETGAPPAIRGQVFDIAFRVLNDASRSRSREAREHGWSRLAELASEASDQHKVIVGLASRETEPWAVAIVRQVAATAEDDRVIDRAEQASASMERRARGAADAVGEDE